MAVEKLTVALAIIASGRKMVMICEAVSIQFSILMPAFWCQHFDASILMPAFWCQHFDASILMPTFWIAQPISLNVGIHRPEYLQFSGGIKSSHSLLFEPSGIKVVEFRTLKS